MKSFQHFVKILKEAREKDFSKADTGLVVENTTL